MKNKQLLYFGIIAPITFWITTLICAPMIDGYNHLSWMVSELGALGTKSQYIFTIGLVLSSAFNIVFVVGLWRFCIEKDLNKVPLFFFLMYSFLAGPALYPMPLPEHGYVGLPMLLIIFAPLVTLLFWYKRRDVIKINTLVIICTVLFGLGFLVYFPDILSDYFGLKQRFLYTAWTIWSIGISYKSFLKNK